MHSVRPVRAIVPLRNAKGRILMIKWTLPRPKWTSAFNYQKHVQITDMTVSQNSRQRANSGIQVFGTQREHTMTIYNLCLYLAN